MYCLKVAIACPDWKRPFIKFIVEHYKNKEDAEKRLNEIKLDYIEDYNITKELLNKTNNNENNDNDSDNYISIEELDVIIKNGILRDYIYEDSYMDHLPFDYEIFEIQLI